MWFVLILCLAQISGFMEMDDFKRRFSQYDEVNGYYFSHSRVGLIVGLVSSAISFVALKTYALPMIAYTNYNK